MVFSNTIRSYEAARDPAYANPEFRSRAGFKEVDTPNPPQRRNRDFKVLFNGDFIGYPKGRSSVPYQQLRNIRDIFEE